MDPNDKIPIKKTSCGKVDPNGTSYHMRFQIPRQDMRDLNDLSITPYRHTEL